jgi:formylglycine-generating enzyme required for sulfatase activity
LNYWKSDFDYGDAKPNSPVTNVSWYVAKKYCESKGKRLATMDEWEYAAMSDAKTFDARKKKSYNQYILNWYETPKTYNNEVGSTFKNYWGVYDMHGLVWEWTSDFNSIFLSGESRKDKGDDGNLFCGGASVNASDLMNYAAFMRYAFRGSMKAAYTGRNLGFRCARDIK